MRDEGRGKREEGRALNFEPFVLRPLGDEQREKKIRVLTTVRALIFLLLFRELVLADRTERADPIFWQILKRRSGFYTVLRISHLGIIDVTAYVANIALHNVFLLLLG